MPNATRNNILLAEIQMKPPTPIIEERRWQWSRHVLQMTGDSLPKVALKKTPQGNRSRGRAKETWRRATAKELCLWKILAEAPCTSGT